jgi:hypothetical protein
VVYLAQAEELLKKQDVTGSGSNTNPSIEIGAPRSSDLSKDFGLEVPFTAPDEAAFSSPRMMTSGPSELFPHSVQDTEANAFLTEDFSWAMIELGVQEPLPPQDTIDELYLSYNFSAAPQRLLMSPELKLISQKSIPRSP